VAETILIAAQFAGAFWCFMMFLAPLAVFWSSRSPCSYTLVALEPDNELKTATPAVVGAMQQLQELGFSISRCSSIAMSHASTGFFVFRKSGDPCLATVLSGRNAFATVAAVEFSQIYVGDACLSLTSSPLPPVYPRWRERVRFALPGATDVQDLFRRFCLLRERNPLGAHLDVPPGGELPVLERLMNREVNYLCEVGFLSDDCDKGSRRSSLWAAYRMSWRMLPPWKQLKLAAERRRTLAASET
jgi:hypothetical protein